MKSSWLRAAIIGLLLGPAPAVAEPVVEPPVEAEESPAGDGSDGHAGGGPVSPAAGDLESTLVWATRRLARGGGLPEATHWRALAERSAGEPPVLTEELEAGLAAWGADAGSDEGISPLGGMLCLLPSLDRTVVVATWATSPHEASRRALARALSAPFDAVGVRGAIEQLQADPSPEVRRLARAAEASRRGPRA